MIKNIYFAITIICLLPFVAMAQGGVELNTSESSPGYALLALRNRAVLIDNCGEIVHDWDNITSAIFHYKLLPNGNLIYVGRGDVIELAWDGSVINRYNVPGLDLQYEVELLPNGNYLCVGRVGVSNNEAEELGFDISVIRPQQLDVVVEIDRNSGDVVWQWNIADHMIQQRDSKKQNYGIVNDHPELLNIDAISSYDWTSGESFMINSMDYNPDLDQIVLSIRKMSEFVIIDHSTTTEEAAGSTGGNQGKGGDIIYRWGNPQNYGQGTEDDRQLYHQHNPNWLDDGPHKGKISVYNNGLSRPSPNANSRYSSADIIDTGVNSDGSYTPNSEGRFEPLVAGLRYNKNTSVDFNFYSGYLSGATILPNGNVWITIGQSCHIIELNPEGDLVWDYSYWSEGVNCFRSVKYPLDYPAFSGKDLTPRGTLESYPNQYDCNLISATAEENLLKKVEFRYNIDRQEISLSNISENLIGNLHDLSGRIIQIDDIYPNNSTIKVKHNRPGFYFYTIKSKTSRSSLTYKLIII